MDRGWKGDSALTDDPGTDASRSLVEENPLIDGSVAYRLDDGIATLHLDDGKANALSHRTLDAFDDALDRAEADAVRALLVIGREGRFSAGFDLAVMRQGPEAAVDLATKGARLAYRIYAWPTPTVFAVTGHALAMGAFILLAADERLGATGPFKIGLNEVSIGMAVPEWGWKMAEARLSRRHYHRACVNAEIYTPEGAVGAGFLDRVAPPESLIELATERARILAETVEARAFRATKLAVRGALLEEISGALGGRDLALSRRPRTSS